MNRDVDNAIGAGGHLVAGRNVLAAFAGPARLDPVRREIAAIDDSVAHRIGAPMRQMHIIVFAADGIGAADPGERRNLALEPALREAKAGEHFQFERHGYFVPDRFDPVSGEPEFNRAVTMKDAWQK